VTFSHYLTFFILQITVGLLITVHVYDQQYNLCTIYLLQTVASGYDGDDEYERMSKHRLGDCHKLREMQHYTATDEDTETESC